MRFEFVEFYPMNECEIVKSKKSAIGTVHIYAIEAELDIRGIRILKNGGSLFFGLPHTKTLDEEGKMVRYPFLRFTNPVTHKEMMDFLHQQVKPKIKEILRTKSKK